MKKRIWIFSSSNIFVTYQQMKHCGANIIDLPPAEQCFHLMCVCVRAQSIPLPFPLSVYLHFAGLQNNQRSLPAKKVIYFHSFQKPVWYGLIFKRSQNVKLSRQLFTNKNIVYLVKKFCTTTASVKSFFVVVLSEEHFDKD